MVYIIKKCLENVCQIKKLYCKKSQMEYKKYTLRDQIHIEEIKTWEQEINKKLNKYKCI